jgi:hypothetical protein
MRAHAVVMLALATVAHAQAPGHPPHWYVSWGYNAESYAPTDIRFVQANGNDFTIHSAKLNDHKSWDVWNHELTVPQYSIRIGRVIGKHSAIEFNFDHAKVILATASTTRVSGMVAGAAIDRSMPASDVVQLYKLNNGANFFLFNYVRSVPLLGVPGQNGSVAFLGKAGLGFMVPHTDNTVLGGHNNPVFQFGGFGAGIEGALRVHLVRQFYIEGAEKGFFGHYRNVHIDQGYASHNLLARGTILSLGAEFGLGGPLRSPSAAQ